MGWDGSGQYTRQRNFSADASAGIRILASAMDQEVDDIASAFNNVLLRDGQAAATGNIPMGGNRLINVGAPTAVNEYMRSRDFIENVPIFMSDNNTATDTVSVSASFFTSVSATQAPRDGTKAMIRMASHKSSAPVMRFSGHSANIHFGGGGVVDGFVSGAIYELVYASAEGVWETYSDRLIPRTPAEIAAGVTPTNYQYEPGQRARYATLADAVAVSATHPLFIVDNETIDAAITVPSNAQIYGIGRPQITNSSAGIRILQGDSLSNVIIDGIRFKGDNSSSTPSGTVGGYAADSTGIVTFTGSSDIRVTNCEVDTFYNGFSFLNCSRLFVKHNYITNWLVYGIIASESSAFAIDHNIIVGCDQAGGADAYGVMATGDDSAARLVQKSSISFNVIGDIPSWDGIMSHSCSGLRIIGNDLRNVRNGIDISAPTAAQVIRDVVIDSNYVESTTTDSWGGGAASHVGIKVIGHTSSHASDVVITNNIVRNFFTTSGMVGSGDISNIVVEYADYATVANNIVTGAGSIIANAGVFAVGDCQALNISGNVLQGTMASGGVRLASVVAEMVSINGNTIKQATATDIAVNITGSTIGELSVTDNPSNSIEPFGISTSTVTFIQEKSETATGTFTADIHIPVTDIDSTAGAVTCTLPDGVIDGQRKKVTMSNATASSTVSVTSHETSDPEVFTFAQVTDVLILEWDSANAYWWTVKNIGVAV